VKPRWLGLLSGLASLGFAYWLVAGEHTSRELLLAMVAWVLGFWVATGIRRHGSEVWEADSDEDPDDENWEDED
jgi:hypothetical protein